MQENIVETKEEGRSMNKTPRKKIFFHTGLSSNIQNIQKESL